MKKIKFDSKLSFNKEVISKLNDEEMGGLKGGRFTSIGKKCTRLAGGCGGDGPRITRGAGCKDPLITARSACNNTECGPITIVFP